MPAPCTARKPACDCCQPFALPGPLRQPQAGGGKKRGPKPKGGDSQAPSGGWRLAQACNWLVHTRLSCSRLAMLCLVGAIMELRIGADAPVVPPSRCAESGRGGKRKADSSGMPSAKRSKEVTA